MLLDVLEADLVGLAVVVVALVIFVPITFPLVFIFALLLIPLLVVKSNWYLK